MAVYHIQFCMYHCNFDAILLMLAYVVYIKGV